MDKLPNPDREAEAVLLDITGPKTLVGKLLEKRELRKYDKEVERTAKFITSDPPASVERRKARDYLAELQERQAERMKRISQGIEKPGQERDLERDDDRW